jgi:hypothetical protein
MSTLTPVFRSLALGRPGLPVRSPGLFLCPGGSVDLTKTLEYWFAEEIRCISSIPASTKKSLSLRVSMPSAITRPRDDTRRWEEN